VSEDVEQIEIDDPEMGPPAPSRRRRGKRREDAAADAVADAVPSLEDVEPDPDGNGIRTLDSLLAKYEVGVKPTYHAILHRLWPKFFAGNVPAAGFLARLDQVFDQETIRSEYGGGTYRVIIMGPDPKRSPNATRPYAQFSFEIAGPPNPNAGRADATPAAAPGMPMIMQQEQPGLASTALKTMAEVSAKDREDRIRAEKEAKVEVERAREASLPLFTQAQQLGKEMLDAERERAKTEREFLLRQISDARDAQQKLEERISQMDQQRPRIADEMRDMQKLFGPSQEVVAAATKANESITTAILERHRQELETISKQHLALVDSLRSTHAGEIAAVRDAHMRELGAEREASRMREQRHEEQLKTEREERRRDAEALRREADARDKAWQERMAQQEERLKTLYESRIATNQNMADSRIGWMQSEMDRLQAKVNELEGKQQDKGDLVSQLGRIKEATDALKGLGLVEPPALPPPTGGGIGISENGQIDWGDMLKTAMTNLPDVIDAMRGGGGQGGGLGSSGGGQQPQVITQRPPPPQQPKVGDVMQTPRGPMVVVQAPNGQLGLMPQQQAPSGRRGPAPRGIFGPSSRRRDSGGLPVPNMADGLPKPAAPWEPTPPQPQQPPAQQQQQQPRPVSRPAAAPPQPPPAAAPLAPVVDGQQVNEKTQRAIANQVAIMVHKSIDEGDEPEEFVEKILSGKYPPVVVKAIASMEPEQVLAWIKQAQPNSAGTTPFGHEFVHKALRALRQAV